MENLRKRIPFSFTQEDDTDNAIQVMDEQEQEELISKLRSQNAESDRKAILFLKVLIITSGLGHLIILATSQNLLILLPILVHVNVYLILVHNSHALSLRLTYTFALIPPTLAYFHIGSMGHRAPDADVDDGPSRYWWLTHLTTPAVVWIAQNVMAGINKATEGLEALEGMKYRAKGA